jgi:hypothetical protein
LYRWHETPKNRRPYFWLRGAEEKSEKKYSSRDDTIYPGTERDGRRKKKTLARGYDRSVKEMATPGPEWRREGEKNSRGCFDLFLYLIQKILSELI